MGELDFTIIFNMMFYPFSKTALWMILHDLEGSLFLTMGIVLT